MGFCIRLVYHEAGVEQAGDNRFTSRQHINLPYGLSLGNQTLKVEPAFTSLSTDPDPPCNSTISFTIANPNSFPDICIDPGSTDVSGQGDAEAVCVDGTIWSCQLQPGGVVRCSAQIAQVHLHRDHGQHWHFAADRIGHQAYNQILLPAWKLLLIPSQRTYLLGIAREQHVHVSGM